MRLAFHVQGDEVVNTLEAGTLSFKRSVPLQADRIRELSAELMSVLERGNRAHTLTESNLRHLREAGEQLTHLLAHPEILERLPAGDEAVYLQLDESLVTVPWELLHDGTDFWGHRYDMGRAVATPQAMIGRAAPMPSSPPLRMLIVCADPRRDLPRVLAEGEALLEQLDQSKAVDANLVCDPTVEAVRRQLKSYDILHFAGHAEHDVDHPEKSGWILADGKLTAADVMGLSGGRSMPMLVFSNACRSSETEAWKAGGHRVYGLANAFLLAGVRLYVGTQWEVVDGQSAELANAFYEALGRGAGAGMAMRVARKKIVREQGPEAMAWASYILYGDPSLAPLRPTEFRQKELLSASLLDARLSVPPKRQITGPQPQLPERHSPPPAPRGARFSGWLAVLSAGVALCALFAVIYLLRQPPPAPTPRLETGKHQAQVAPLVALLVAEEAPLGQCLRRGLERERRFRLLPREKLRGAAGATMTREQALRVAQAYAAEVVVYVEGQQSGKPRVAVADVLTGEVPIIATVDALPRETSAASGTAAGTAAKTATQPASRPTTRPAGSGNCPSFIAEMVRVLLGEGHVLAVKGEKVTVDLGWRSRVAPGVVLLIMRAGRPAGSLTVEGVEMDRCVARGRAQVGDLVRLPR